MASVICGTTKRAGRNVVDMYRDSEWNSLLTLHSLAQVVASAFLLNDQTVDFPRRYVVVPMQCYIKEALVVTQIKIHFSSVIQNINFTWRKIKKKDELVIELRRASRGVPCSYIPRYLPSSVFKSYFGFFIIRKLFLCLVLNGVHHVELVATLN